MVYFRDTKLISMHGQVSIEFPICGDNIDHKLVSMAHC